MESAASAGLIPPLPEEPEDEDLSSQEDEEEGRENDDWESSSSSDGAGYDEPQVSRLIQQVNLATSRPRPDKTYTRCAMLTTGEKGLSALKNLTDPTMAGEFPPAATIAVIAPEVIQMIVQLVKVPETEQLTLRATQIIDNVARLETTHDQLAAKGVVQHLVTLLEDLGSKEREVASTPERTCRAVIGALRSLLEHDGCYAQVALSSIPVLLISIIRNGSTWEKWLAAGCLAQLCRNDNQDLAYQSCCAGALVHLMHMLQHSKDENTTMCSLAAISRLASCSRTHSFFTKYPKLIPMLIDLYELDDSEHGTHEVVQTIALWALVHLSGIPEMQEEMVYQGLPDLALDILSEELPTFHEISDLSRIVFKLAHLQTPEVLDDTVKTFLALLEVPGLEVSPCATLFVAYLLDYMVPNHLQALVAERGGIRLASLVMANLPLPRRIREDAVKLLLILAEQYTNLPKFFDCGVLELVCAYLLPSSDSTEATKTLCGAIMRAMYIYNDKDVSSVINSRFPFLKRVLFHNVPEVAPFLTSVKESRRQYILDTAVIDREVDPQELEALKEKFKEFDPDLSATLDTHELRTMFKALGINLSWLQVLAVMRAADTDKSGEIEFNEFVCVIDDFKHGKITGLGYIKDVLMEKMDQAMETAQNYLDENIRGKVKKEAKSPDDTSRLTVRRKSITTTRRRSSAGKVGPYA